MHPAQLTRARPRIAYRQPGMRGWMRSGFFAAGMLCNALASASIGLDGPWVNSHLGDPLLLNFNISHDDDVPPLRLKLLGEESYQIMGLSPPEHLLSDFRISVTNRAPQRTQVQIRSRSPVVSPILSLLLQMELGEETWIRRLDFLVDPRPTPKPTPRPTPQPAPSYAEMPIDASADTTVTLPRPTGERFALSWQLKHPIVPRATASPETASTEHLPDDAAGVGDRSAPEPTTPPSSRAAPPPAERPLASRSGPMPILSQTDATGTDPSQTPLSSQLLWWLLPLLGLAGVYLVHRGKIAYRRYQDNHETGQWQLHHRHSAADDSIDDEDDASPPSELALWLAQRIAEQQPNVDRNLLIAQALIERGREADARRILQAAEELGAPLPEADNEAMLADEESDGLSVALVDAEQLQQRIATLRQDYLSLEVSRQLQVTEALVDRGLLAQAHQLLMKLEQIAPNAEARKA